MTKQQRRSMGFRISLVAGIALGAFAGTSASLAQEAEPDEGEIVVSARKRIERLVDVPVAANVLSGRDIAERGLTGLEGVQNVAPQLSIDPIAAGSGGAITLRGIGSTADDSGIESSVSLNFDGVSTSRGRLATMALFDLDAIEVLKGPQALYFGKNSPGGVVSISSRVPGDSFEGYLTTGFEPYSEEYYGEGAISAPLGGGFSARLAMRGSIMQGGYIKNVAQPITDPASLPLALRLGNTLGLPGQPAFGPPVPLPGAGYDHAPHARQIATRLTLAYGAKDDPISGNLKFLYARRRDTSALSLSTTTGCGAAGAQVRFDFSGPLIDPSGHCDIRRQQSYGTVPDVVAAGIPGANEGTPYGLTNTYFGALTLDLKVAPEITLTSVTGFNRYTYRDFGTDVVASSFAIGAVVNHDKYRAWSQELRIATDFDAAVNFSGGVFFEDFTHFVRTNALFGYAGPNPPGFAFTGDLTGGRMDSLDTSHDQSGKTYSAYGELRWKIVPNVELAGGVRYTDESRRTDARVNYAHLALLGTGLIAPAGYSVAGKIQQDNWSPQATLSWHPARNVMVYAAYKKGFQSGGFSSPAIIAPGATAATFSFRQETAAGGEIGLKFENVNDERLSGDLTIFDYKYKGLQLTQFDPTDISFHVRNAGSAKITGAELNLTFTATDRLSLHAAVAYNHARYTDYRGASCWVGQTAAQGCLAGVQDLTGRPLTRAPEWVGSVGATYEQPLSNQWSLGLSINARFSSEYYYSLLDSPYSKQGRYAVLDASARLFSRDGWEFSVIGKNLTDRIYVTFGGDLAFSGPGTTFGNLNLPRQIMLQVSRRF